MLPWSCNDARAKTPCKTGLVVSDGSDRAVLKMNCAKTSSSVGPSISDLDSLTEMFLSAEDLDLESRLAYRIPVDAPLLCL